MPQRDTGQSALRCYRCGGSLESLSLPLVRLDLCPDCGVELHVCRMCSHYAPSKPDACDEEDAIAVRDKTAANFCDYFDPDAHAFDGRDLSAESAARSQLGALFGDNPASGGASAAGDGGQAARSDTGGARDPALEQAEDLFRK